MDLTTNSLQYTQLPPEEVRICVAEDNRVNRKVLEKFLDRLCYSNFHMYENGQDAVDGVRQQAANGKPYHIILMDTAMPVMDGFRATKILRQDENEAIRSVPIIALYACSVIKLDTAAKGMTDVLLKPVAVSNLRSILETYGNPLVGFPFSSLVSDTNQSQKVVEAEPSIAIEEAKINGHQETSWLRPRL
ncbi:Histidine protein kinase SLN1 [Paramyrothecium foliicola]|nr:Histidine protein kinase SLN1 [Paramyrothecium foliicola]